MTTTSKTPSKTTSKTPSKTTTLSIEIDERDALVLHIESLQSALTKRNNQIAILESRIAAGEGSPLIAEAYSKGRVEGWKACANHLANATLEAARSLSEVRKEALGVYYRDYSQEGKRK